MSRILVIEDEEAIRANLRRFLRLEAHEVIEAADGRAGVEAARARPPDLIICDLMMPELDGFAVLREVRNDPATRHVAFCFLTASAEKATRRSGLALSADAYLSKPFELAEMRAVLDRLLDPPSRGD
ncbi:MAG: response regulator [Rhodocyclaceae bacterium]|nr:response regulator [Rhodocyclaceae bacterium]